MMNIEEVFFLINFDTVDIADVMIGDTHGEGSDDDYVLSLLKDENLSFESLEGSTGVIDNKNKQFNIDLDANGKRYKLALVEFLGRDKYFKIVRMFDEPQKVRISNISPQIGGMIDTNYGIKFNIEFLK